MADDKTKDPAVPGTPSDSGEAGVDGTPSDSGEGTPTYATWADYAKDHPEADALHQADKAAVAGALEKEREKAKTASAQLRELAKTADPETAERLRKAAAEKDAENESLRKQLDFQTAAVGLGCRVVDKAWQFAKATGMTAEQMKADPDLAHWFSSPAPRVNAGAGTGDKPASKDDFNSILRRHLGVG